MSDIEIFLKDLEERVEKLEAGNTKDITKCCKLCRKSYEERIDKLEEINEDLVAELQDVELRQERGCEKCNPNKPLNYWHDLNNEYGVDVINGEAYMKFIGSSPRINITYFRVHYCPNCGRKMIDERKELIDSGNNE